MQIPGTNTYSTSSSFQEESALGSIDKAKLTVFAQALKNQNTGMDLKDFLENQVKNEIDSINKAMEQVDFKELKFLYHHLLSTSSALGLVKLAILSRKAEDSSVEQDTDQLRKFTLEINQELQKILNLPYHNEDFFTSGLF